ncbi:hypothetical protein VNO78_21391 [Psophocarpus tetragonolobus]|uniref:Uncharacterized protein n=1 Tax=Psophocarpus tetragonolobus TaxID=3891 RepID=A0AAN9SC92_PSOTE
MPRTQVLILDASRTESTKVKVSDLVNVELGVSICLHVIGIVGCGWPVKVDSCKRDGLFRIGPCVAYLFKTLNWVDRSTSGVYWSACTFWQRCALGLNWLGRASNDVTLKKLECLKQTYA